MGSHSQVNEWILFTDIKGRKFCYSPWTCIHTIAYEIGWLTVAEYVQAKKQADILGEIGINYLPGTYIGMLARLDTVLCGLLA